YVCACFPRCLGNREGEKTPATTSVTVENFFHLRPPFSGPSRIERALHWHHDRPPFFCRWVCCDTRHIGLVIRPMIFVVPEEVVVFQKDRIVANVRAPDRREDVRPDVL